MSFVLGQTSKIFGFPHPVNEFAARLVAGMVAILCIVLIISDVRWLIPVLAYGFFARVISGQLADELLFQNEHTELAHYKHL